MSSDSAGAPVTHEALLEFLYRAPIGLVQAGLDGRVEMINPMAAQLLLPVVGDGALDDVFAIFALTAPELEARVRAFREPAGTICEALKVDVPATWDRPRRILSLGVTRIDEARLMVTVMDATAECQREEKAAARRLHEAARVDPLTRLPNRVALVEHLSDALFEASVDEAATRRATRSVLLVALDRMQQIVHLFGGATGDAVLAGVADRLRGAMRGGAQDDRRPDQLLARVDGDAFAVFVDNLRDSGDALAIGTRLIDAMAKPFHVGGQAIHCRISIGIVHDVTGVTLEDDMAARADALLRDAALAAAEAKGSGESRCVLFDRAMHERAVHRSGIEMELGDALAGEQLFVVYQPVVDLRGGDGTAGVEALVRWRHPVRGLIPPTEFIGIAEESGLIGALGAFVLTTACREFADWRARFGAAAPRLLAVNLSRAQLVDPGLVPLVARTLAANDMPPGALQLEVTESLAGQDAAVRDRLAALRGLGVSLALDDFGTGYSSLSSLHELPVTTVKIDRSFVSLLETSPHHRVLIEATVKVAKSLGMSTVAEGIETAAQARGVRETGCDKAQGWYFGRPMEAAALATWLDGDPATNVGPRLRGDGRGAARAAP